MEFTQTQDKKRILLIEDNQETQLIFKVYLRSLYDLELAADAETGLSMLKNFPFDLLLLDIHLPGKKDGNDVLTEIRQHLDKNVFPIIVVTAYALKGDKEKFFLMGANDFIPKPVEKESLLNKISAVLT